MDINDLLRRHQISLMNERVSVGAETQLAHRELSRLYLVKLRDAGYTATRGMARS